MVQILSDDFHVLTQPLGFQHFDVPFRIDGMGQQFLLKIERRTQVKLKDGNIFSRFDLLLRGVQRQRTDILPLDALHPDTYPLDGAILVNGHPERIGEIGLGVEIFGQREGIFCRAKLLDTVQSVNTQPLVAQTASHNIPPLPKHLDAVGCHFERTGCIIPETLVGQLQGQIIPHRLDNLCQEALSGWNLLEENASLEVVALVDKVVSSHVRTPPRSMSSACSM